MEKTLVFGMFSKDGIIDVEIDGMEYRYLLDGIHVESIRRQSLKYPWVALNRLKKIARDVLPLGGVNMAKTKAAETVDMFKAVKDQKEVMRHHGNFTMAQSKGGSFKVFPAPCDCEKSRISGLLFFKWLKRNRTYKTFDRLKLVIVCFRCGAKGHFDEDGNIVRQELVIDPREYNVKHAKFDVLHWFLKKYNIKWWTLK